VWGDRVYITCYSGFATDRQAPGRPEELRRHLLCVDRQSGQIVWNQMVEVVHPEDPYQGFITEHGYASSTPVTDGERVFAFFGKSGVIAYDMQGTRLWQVDVGDESSNRRWGSAASLVLYNDSVIVNACEESQSIRALDKATGKEIWRAEASSLELAYNTPALVDLGDGKHELIIGVPNEVWGLDPDTGKLNWFAETSLEGNICPTVIQHDGLAFVFGGYISVGSLALRVGGKGDVTDSHVVWTSRITSYVATPLFHDGHLYWVDDKGIAHCIESQTGEVVYRERLSGLSRGGKPVYASPVLAGGRLFVVSRRNGTFVFPARPQFQQIAQNRFASDDTDFHGTPAISKGQMFLRSNKFLYCVAAD
jgi:outer membrane protein assembly factor BamB